MIVNLLITYATWTAILLVIYYLFRLWMEGKSFRLDVRCDGKTIIITGANSGIGYETALNLAKRGGKIIMACRNKEYAEIACQNIIKLSGNTNVHVMHLDLASFRSIRMFAKEFHRQESRLDILINNAGIMGVSKILTEDGIESHMAVNYLGHFLLTLLLLDMINKSKPSRIVNVSSLGHTFVNWNKNSWDNDISYNRFDAYLQSKLANVMFTVELGKRLKNSGVTINALHPGVVYTDISRNLKSFCALMNRSICNFIGKYFLQSSKSGAETSVYVALDFNLQTVSGQYFDNLEFAKMNEDACNKEYLTWLWNKSEEVTGVTLNNNCEVIDHFPL